jgi:CRISPR-associated protein Cas2
MAAGMSHWVVSYDIPNDKRRRQVSKVLEGYRQRVQFSVFECELDETKCDRLEKQLRQQIDEDEDDVRFYPLNQADLQRVKMLGIAELRQK